MKVPESSSPNSERQTTSTSSHKTSQNTTQQEVQNETLTTQAKSSNSSEQTGLVTSRYDRTIKPNCRYTEQLLYIYIYIFSSSLIVELGFC